jgi:multidrug resistance efflux pump
MVAKQGRVPTADVEASEEPTIGLPDPGAVPKPNPTEPSLVDRVGALDIQAQSALLQEAFESPRVPGSDSIEPAFSPSPQPPGQVSRWAWRALKSAIGLAIVAVAGVGPVQRLLEFSSVDAVVNARLVSLRAPIDGRVDEASLSSAIGATAHKGAFMLRISNDRADRSRLDDLRRMVDQIAAERSAIGGRLVRLKELHGQLSEQSRAFQSGRIKELEERVMDLKAQVAAAEAARIEATSALERTKALATFGGQSKTTLERAQRDATVAGQTQSSYNHRLFATEVELEAARRGDYIGDTYNDRPSSSQQADELSIRIAEADAELSARDLRLDKLRTDLAAEETRYANLSNVILPSPIDAQVWEVLVSAGEEVRRGQDLLRLLDCSGTVVTTTVRESVFNQLRIGDKTQFRFSGQSGIYNGEIIRLTGAASPPDNLAIQSSPLSSAAYRVVVSVPELASAECKIGRSGRVVFQSAKSSVGIIESIRTGLSSIVPGL